jgi:hypothetical protein
VCNKSDYGSKTPSIITKIVILASCLAMQELPHLLSVDHSALLYSISYYSLQEEHLFLLAREVPITVVALSKAQTVFAYSNVGDVCSNPTQCMDICVRLFSVCDVLFVGSGLATDRFPVHGVLPTVYRNKKLRSGQGLTKGL